MPGRRIAFAVAAGVFAVAACLYLAGCGNPFRSGSPADSAVLRAGGDAARHLAVTANVGGFFLAGVLFVALGGLAFCFGGGRTAASVFCLGVVTAGVGVLFSEYPWTVPLLAAGVVGVLAVSWWDRRRTLRALAVTTEVIETCPEGRAIKDGIKDRGQGTEEAVRAIVGPLKAGLRKKGVLPGCTRSKDAATSIT